MRLPIEAPLAGLVALWAGAVLAQAAPATEHATQMNRLAICSTSPMPRRRRCSRSSRPVTRR